ncbi:DUF2237 family protein [Lacimicrobium alkaliphilum]|uniref:DUF2237 domain-containing protein n=1 Tax=Lacimicrobium alkaliphilum TaxID=1526571 RepID=A0A0U2QKU9_9ALTE|nr:DUF2237 domain-containing protein [Lacimicrobium alkaliphilum]ALS97899.1 hypothetical protein AT746_06205 [Lacimicrobium alkaliphilum]
MANAKNVLGEPLQLCCGNGGFTREGFCYVPAGDIGNHSVCAIMTDAFLEYSKAQGNDLSTPNPLYDFPGLKTGDRWCLCASRWLEAHRAGVAPGVVLAAVHEAALKVVPLKTLQQYAIQPQ